MAEQFRKGVFISYSHEDKEWLERITTVLSPLVQNETIAVWDDRQIAPGQDWKQEIEQAIATSRAAILLVSPDFLASKFIMQVEMPLIMERVRQGLTVFWIPIRASLYEETPLAQLQAAHDPGRPLASLSRADREEALTEIARKIRGAMDVNVVANVLRVIDDFTPKVEAYVEDQPQPVEREYRITARETGHAIHLETRTGYVKETITADDLDKLSSAGKQFIRSRERTLQDLYDTSTELYPKRYAQDTRVRDKARKEYVVIVGDICEVLNEILDYLQSIGKNLEDHYSEIRFLCTKSSNLN